MTIEGGNITIASPGTITVHASKKSFVGGVQLDQRLPVFPSSDFCLSCFLKAAKTGTALVPA